LKIAKKLFSGGITNYVNRKIKRIRHILILLWGGNTWQDASVRVGCYVIRIVTDMTTENDFGTAKVEQQAVCFIDLSNFVHTAFWPAYDAFLADKQKYPYQRVLFTNVEGKLGTIAKDFGDNGIHSYGLIFVEDRTSKRKYDLFPGYKAGRGADDDAEKSAARHWLKTEGMGRVKAWLKERGYCTFAWSEDNEADDTIATLVEKVRGKAPVIVASSDKDLWQLFDPPSVDIYHMTKGCFLAHEDIAKKFNGVDNPKFIPLVKALWGDTSDAIPNAVPRMQKQLVPLITASDGTIEDFITRTIFPSANLTARCKELLKLGAEQVQINYKLAKLDLNCKVTWERG
jgi:5'-3' exonuclease